MQERGSEVFKTYTSERRLLIKSCFQFFSIQKLATAAPGKCSYINTVMNTVHEQGKAEPGSDSIPFTCNIHILHSQCFIVHMIFMGVNQELPCKVRSWAFGEALKNLWKLSASIASTKKPKTLKTRKSCALKLRGGWWWRQHPPSSITQCSLAFTPK